METPIVDDRKALFKRFGFEFFEEPRVSIFTPDYWTVGKFWKQHRNGCFALYTLGRYQPDSSVNMFVTLLIDGVLRCTAGSIFRRQLILAEQFVDGAGIKDKLKNKGSV